MSGGDLRAAATQTTFLRNVLMRDPDYRLSLRAIKAAPGDEAEPFTHFLLLETPVFRPAPPDLALAFNPSRCQITKRHSGTGSELSRLAARARRWSPKPTDAKCISRAARTFPFPGGPSAAPAAARGHSPRRFQLRLQNRSGACGRRRSALDAPRQPERFHRCDRAEPSCRNP